MNGLASGYFTPWLAAPTVVDPKLKWMYSSDLHDPNLTYWNTLQLAVKISLPDWERRIIITNVVSIVNKCEPLGRFSRYQVVWPIQSLRLMHYIFVQWLCVCVCGGGGRTTAVMCTRASLNITASGVLQDCIFLSPHTIPPNYTRKVDCQAKQLHIQGNYPHLYTLPSFFTEWEIGPN